MKKKKANKKKNVMTIDKKALRKYIPTLARMGGTRQQWENSAPRLTEEQKRQVQEITRNTYYKHMKVTPTRATFNAIHERIEEELYDKIREQLGLVAALDWRITFGESAIHHFAQYRIPHPNFVDSVLPTEDFLNSELFDYVQVFEPVVTLFQFEDYDKFMKSAEESISDAERRRERGDAYYTDLDKQISFRPDVGVGDSLED